MVETKLLKIMGIIMMQRAQHAMTMKILRNFAMNSLPISWLSILKGLSENEILPTGAGRYGSMLGSVRAFPTGVFLACSPGKILRSSRILISLPSFVVPRKKVSSSRNSR